MIQTVLLGNVRLEHQLMNAAGEVKLLEDVEKLARSAVSAIVVGSITVEPRPGNSGETFYSADNFSLNSRGIPNPGSEYYRENLPRMVRVAHANGKKLIVSVAGFTSDEYVSLTELAVAGGADLVEENFGCPNIWDGGKQKRIASYDPKFLDFVLGKTAGVVPAWKTGLLLKMSPLEPALIQEHSYLMRNHQHVYGVIGSNTFPNAFAWNDSGDPAITPAEGLGSLSGPCMKPIALGQVHQWRKFLPRVTAVIGAGGIASGRDVADYLRAGAAAVQVGTHFFRHGPNIFSEILGEMADLEEA